MTSTKDNKFFYGWWIVLGSILVTGTIVPSVIALANKFLIPVTEDLNISRSAFTLSNTILQAMGIFFSTYASRKISNGNLRKIQSVSILIFSVMFASYGFAKRPIHFYISSFILGFFFLFTSLIPVSLMVPNWFKEKRGLAMSLALSGSGVGGFVLSPLLTSWINNYGWRNAYMIFALVMLVVSLPISLFVFAKTPEEKGLKPYGSDKDIDPSKASAASFKLGISARESITKPFFILLVIGMALNGLINTGALGQFPPALEELHGASTAAAIISLYSLIGVFGKVLTGWINDKFGIIPAVSFGTISFGLAFVAMLFGESLAAVYIMALLFGLGLVLGPVMPPLLTSEIFEPEKYGEVYGYVNSASQLGLTFGSLLVASIYDVSNSYNLAWIIMIVITIITLTSWILAYKRSLKYRI